MKPPLTPYTRVLDAAPAEPLQLPAHVDGQLHLTPATFFLLGAICGALATLLCAVALAFLFLR